MCTATSQFWDSNKDKIFKVYFEQPKSGISCCVTIYALSVKIDNAAEMEQIGCADVNFNYKNNNNDNDNNNNK